MSKLLVVEDDQMMARLYEKIFKFENYEVSFAVNGQDALEKLQINRPDLILMDVMMPIMNGIQALKKIKANLELSKIPVIMLSNLASQRDMDAALAEGAERYMVKSEYDPSQVAEIVKRVLHKFNTQEILSPVA